jgi:hypothetical protein
VKLVAVAPGRFHGCDEVHRMPLLLKENPEKIPALWCGGPIVAAM